MIIVLYLVVCPIVFILFDDGIWEGKVLKRIKDVHFLVFLVVWAFSPSFWTS